MPASSSAVCTGQAKARLALVFAAVQLSWVSYLLDSSHILLEVSPLSVYKPALYCLHMQGVRFGKISLAFGSHIILPHSSFNGERVDLDISNSISS